MFTGVTPIRHGFRVQLYNDNSIKLDTAKSGFEDGMSDPDSYSFSLLVDPQYPQNNSVAYPNDYQIEFFETIVDTSLEVRLFPPNFPQNFFPAVPVNFKVKNLTTDEYIDFFYRKTGTLSSNYSIYFKELIDTALVNTWRVVIGYFGSDVPLETEGVLNLFTKKPFRNTDYYKFKTSSAGMNSSIAKNELDLIKVVPNPYVITHDGESRLLSNQTSGRGEREIRFTHVPPGSKISIFTVRGELIKTLYHDDIYVGDVYWNLRTEENLDVAYGVYVFVAETPDSGSKIGKFALIK
jgi:hypothetical protein